MPALTLAAAAPLNLATAAQAAPSTGLGPSLVVLIALAAAVVGLAAGVFIHHMLIRRSAEKAKAEADAILTRAKEEAGNIAERIRLEAEAKALERKERTDAELDKSRSEIRDAERRLGKREDLLDRKEQSLGDKERALDAKLTNAEARAAELEQRKAEADALVEQQTEKLHQVSGLSPEAARDLVLERVEERVRKEAATLTRAVLEEAEQDARDKAAEITLQAIQRYAAETTSESTVRTVEIPSDDMKGRIIGREGRNIRAIEKATGVDIIVDDTPGVIVVSSFDKVRQAVAVEALRRLVADGRMHPTRIEEVVEKVRGEIEAAVVKHGKDAALEVQLKGFHPKVIEAMGKMFYRTSYGQNVLQHSIEVAYFSQIIADQLGLDGRLARRAGFLHDIGKAMDHEMEGGHPAIGMAFAKQYGETEEAVLNAIGGHHGDIPATTWYTPIVMAADAVSSARPGARRESMERYVQRLTELQDIALGQPGVVEAHAIQAGREVRVMIDADRVSDDEAYLIAHNITKRVSDEMTFPGEIRVTVLRETRAIEIAR